MQGPKCIHTSIELRFTTPIDNKTKDMISCPVCFDVMFQTPPVTTPCGHTICEECVSSLHAQVCPTCREPFRKDALSRTPIRLPVSYAIRNFIAAMECFCTHANDNTDAHSCTWKGTVGDIMHHLQFQCEFQKTPCPNAHNGCPALLTKSQHTLHTCAHAPWVCPHCVFEGVSASAYTAHIARACVANPNMPCPNAAHCPFVGFKTDVLVHWRNECDFTMIHCPVKKCSFAGERVVTISHINKVTPGTPLNHKSACTLTLQAGTHRRNRQTLHGSHRQPHQHVQA